MPRFFLDEILDGASELEIRGSDYHHIVHVLRLNAGDEIRVSDAAGADLSARIVHISSDCVRAGILSRTEGKTEPPFSVLLCQGLPKSDKMDLICRQAVELGATDVVVFQAARSDVRLSADKLKNRAERWQKILEAAAKQSGRGRLPQLTALPSFEALLERMGKADFAFFPYECEKDHTLGHWLKQEEARLRQAGPEACLAFVIGPEGGFAPEEAEALQERGILPLSLGPRILRTETAGAAVLARVLGFLEA